MKKDNDKRGTSTERNREEKNMEFHPKCLTIHKF